jgi:hypothetical protein
MTFILFYLILLIYFGTEFTKRSLDSLLLVAWETGPSITARARLCLDVALLVPVVLHPVLALLPALAIAAADATP